MAALRVLSLSSLQGSLKGFTAHIRGQLCTALSLSTKQPLQTVSIEGIRAPPKPSCGVLVTLHVQLGDQQNPADKLAVSWKPTLLNMIKTAEAMSPVVAAVGALSGGGLELNVVSVTPHLRRAPSAVQSAQAVTAETSTQLIEVLCFAKPV